MPDSSAPTDPINERIARFKELTPSPQAFVDTRLPEHMRDIYNVIGHGVTEDPSLNPAITDAQDFNLTYIGAEPGKGAALHDHPTVEVFVPMTGRWKILWGEDGEEIELGPFDVISVPPGVMRGFRNISDEHAFMMAILGGSNSGKVTWAKKVLDEAERSGLKLDADGNIVELAD